MFFGTLTHPLSMNANLSQVGNGNRPQWRPRKLLHEVTPPYRYSVQRVQGKTLVAHCAPEPGATDRLFSGQSAEVRPATDRLSSVVLFVGLHSFSHFLPRISPARSSKPATFGPLRLQTCAFPASVARTRAAPPCRCVACPVLHPPPAAESELFAIHCSCFATFDAFGDWRRPRCTPK